MPRIGRRGALEAHCQLSLSPVLPLRRSGDRPGSPRDVLEVLGSGSWGRRRRDSSLFYGPPSHSPRAAAVCAGNQGRPQLSSPLPHCSWNRAWSLKGGEKGQRWKGGMQLSFLVMVYPSLKTLLWME
ncbi:uncharacterized protein ACOB8E_021543 isoform 2-T2 [Sarcophilus harrisii]